MLHRNAVGTDDRSASQTPHFLAEGSDQSHKGAHGVDACGNQALPVVGRTPTDPNLVLVGPEEQSKTAGRELIRETDKHVVGLRRSSIAGQGHSRCASETDRKVLWRASLEK